MSVQQDRSWPSLRYIDSDPELERGLRSKPNVFIEVLSPIYDVTAHQAYWFPELLAKVRGHTRGEEAERRHATPHSLRCNAHMAHAYGAIPAG
jgi:hypothetical protein